MAYISNQENSFLQTEKEIERFWGDLHNRTLKDIHMSQQELETWDNIYDPIDNWEEQ